MNVNITTSIIDIFKSRLGWNAQYSANPRTLAPNTGGQITLRTNTTDVTLICEIKKTVIPSGLPIIINTIQQINQNKLNAEGVIILANYISTDARGLLQKSNINYADTAGNIFFKHKDIHIHLETGQNGRSTLVNNGGRAFTKTGLKVIHQFFRTNQIVNLNDNILNLNDNYRKIAKEANVSIDTVSKVMKDLLRQGYILKKNKSEFKWRAKKELFEKWVRYYNQILRPNLASQRFKFVTKPIKENLLFPGYRISGYNAAKLHYTIPPDKQIINPEYIYYSRLPIRDAIKNLQLIPSENGNVIVYEAFWTYESKDYASVDHIISYADLANTNDPRYLDIAQLFYKNYFHDKL